MCYRTRLLLLTVAMFVCSSLLHAQTLDPILEAGETAGPDLLHTLGVGARAIAMGSAFTAVADDASASFWNPARLGEIPYFQAQVQFRDAMRYTVITSNLYPQMGDYWDSSNVERDGLSRVPNQLAFIGFAKPIGEYDEMIGSTLGCWALSYNLGGYLNLKSRRGDRTEMVIDDQTVYLRDLLEQDFLVTNHFMNLSYGRNVIYEQRARVSAPPRRTVATARAPREHQLSPLLDSPNRKYIDTQSARIQQMEEMRAVADMPAPVKTTAGLVDTPGTRVAQPAPPVAHPPLTESASFPVASVPQYDDVAQAPRDNRLYKIGLGGGLFYLTQEQTMRYVSASFQGLDPDRPEDDLRLSYDMITPVSASGYGYGYMLAVTAEFFGQKTESGQIIPHMGGRWRLGATYRSAAEVSGLTIPMPEGQDYSLGDMFGREVPARITAGLAYEFTEPAESVRRSPRIRAPRQFTISGEVQHFTRANNDPTQIDNRNAVTNMHFGVEYIPTIQWLPIPFLRRYTTDGMRLAYVQPIRLGVRTNNSGSAYGYYKDDTVISGGLALYYSPERGGSRGNYEFSLEPTAEYFIEANETIFSMSSSYRF